MKAQDNKKGQATDVYTLLSTGFSGNVIVDYAPITERYWQKGDVAKINNGQIRISGCWFKFDDRYVVKACT
jgi:hypothetical protein